MRGWKPHPWRRHSVKGVIRDPWSKGEKKYTTADHQISRQSTPSLPSSSTKPRLLLEIPQKIVPTPKTRVFPYRIAVTSREIHLAGYHRESKLSPKIGFVWRVGGSGDTGAVLGSRSDAAPGKRWLNDTVDELYRRLVLLEGMRACTVLGWA
ncbi:hypothetical protein B9Z19DRAFT_1076327 [Tuber borchii]|uniref:Uncharacterized protein n=1 Tax=Tuber borchii TaxID=42251 RepID=A0A2T7A225_TUBBO|nr:hypothetical protein B9Z19DRAFT_1076327 [Tuber borchii]